MTRQSGLNMMSISRVSFWPVVVLAIQLACMSGTAIAQETQDVPGQPVQPVSVVTLLESAADSLAGDRPAEALATLRQAESIEPDNPWLWYYTGLAHLQLEDWYRAMESLDKSRDLLAGFGDPDPALADSIREARSRARRRVFHMGMQIGLAYDSNVTFLGDAGDTFDVISGRGDARFLSRFDFAYAPIADATERLTIRGRLAHAWQFSVEDFNYQDYGATIHYQRRLDEHWVSSLQYDYDITYLDNESFASVHSLTPSLAYAWNGGDGRFRPNETRLSYRIDARDFLFDTERQFDRDGFVNAVAFDQSFKFRPIADREWIWDVFAGYSFASLGTEGREFDEFAHDFYAGVGVPLRNPWLPARDMRLNFTADVQIGDYRRAGLLDRNYDERHDVITTLDLVLEHPLTADPDRGDLTLNTIVGWTDADSNIVTRDFNAPFRYDKWIVGMQLIWSW
ncbi:MAG: hypothetical protein HOP29_03300 [Phycisphaerales bacterium]|nr:hypothetical protein [Phycisphaerales bacterium]